MNILYQHIPGIMVQTIINGKLVHAGFAPTSEPFFTDKEGKVVDWTKEGNQPPIFPVEMLPSE